MKQIKKAVYGVAAGETVTVEITAVKTGYFARMYLNSVVLTPSSQDPLQFQFAGKGVVAGTDYAVVSCHFANDAPDDAEYRLKLIGTQFGGAYDGPIITKVGTTWDQDLTFIVE